MSKATAAKQRRTHKWADFQKEADTRSAGVKPPVKAEPFIIDDVEPPIIIEPPDEKTTLLISEQIGILTTDMAGDMESVQRVLPLLRAFCGDQFPRVWMLLPRVNTSHYINILMQALVEHFEGSLKMLAQAREAAELPGGSEASSDS